MEKLKPSLDCLAQEYVLVQAWKKTSAYVRYHNWFSDTLELDQIASNLPAFISDLTSRLRKPATWQSDFLRIVPAPKSQQWRVDISTKRWSPTSPLTHAKLRPLAHVSLRDQVVATALMMCLADRVETLQGDPRGTENDPVKRSRVTSYGNRLFCDSFGDRLQHRWGSSKLYRAYFQDYQAFLTRPDEVAGALKLDETDQIFIVQSDLSQFYDRVRPALLQEKLSGLMREGDDPSFFAFANQLLNWSWHKDDRNEILKYANDTDIPHFTSVALSQGLVAAGFFANLVLLDFDALLRSETHSYVAPSLKIEDAARYVDDLRVVIRAPKKIEISTVNEVTTTWLQRLLNSAAGGLRPSLDKTRSAIFRGEERPLVRQSRSMARIQGAISGGFDAFRGEEILSTVQGLIRTQERYSEDRTSGQGWSPLPIPDTRDATVARFAAGKFRTTYRALRPLLSDDEEAHDDKITVQSDAQRTRSIRSRQDLDEETRTFALGLIEDWVADPSNVRLLRIALDLWPASEVLQRVLGLLRPYITGNDDPTPEHRIAWYCMSEILRAGATETGLVEEDESLPQALDLKTYRRTLLTEAVDIASQSSRNLPWYLQQQALLFLTTCAPSEVPQLEPQASKETSRYRRFLGFLRSEVGVLGDKEFATHSIVARRTVQDAHTAISRSSIGLTKSRLEEIAQRDPSFGLELLRSAPHLRDQLSQQIRFDLCLSAEQHADTSLAAIVLSNPKTSPLRNELAILSFALKFLEQCSMIGPEAVVTPSQVRIRLTDKEGMETIRSIHLASRRQSRSIYAPPAWCPTEERWRFHLGYLLRFILTGHADFTKSAHPAHWKEERRAYRAGASHWYERLYGLYNGHSAFGDDWLPISEWVEHLLFSLLRWPGCRKPSDAPPIDIAELMIALRDRRAKLSSMATASPNLLVLPLGAQCLIRDTPNILRACVLQTVIPTPDDFKGAPELTLSDTQTRRKHRNHLSSALIAVERMLDLRETHRSRGERLDLLILPELSVHPRDVSTHLIPFARKHRTIILAGLTFEELFSGEPLINSALWIIPTWSSRHGLQIVRRRQGKKHLAPVELKLIAAGKKIQGFRPCQWIVEYQWSVDNKPLRLAASVCYDATDINLTATLRDWSDVFAIPALNQDVGTFDQLASTLHYHMFQMIVVANNGSYGGSNAYFPHRDSFTRQIFHLHGQPQASVAFFEIDNIAAFLERKTNAKRLEPDKTPSGTATPKWKFPPAGM